MIITTNHHLHGTSSSSLREEQSIKSLFSFNTITQQQQQQQVSDGNNDNDGFSPCWAEMRKWLPTRVNLSRKGVLLDSHLCPICNAAMEDVQHVFFRCDVARVVLRLNFVDVDLGIGRR
ncbi:RNA-directed DNA polymerase, eukaryota [Tanacetum coccineum]